MFGTSKMASNVLFFSFVPLVLALIWLPYGKPITLEEGLKNPDEYIRYDRGPFNIGLHVGLSLLLTYSILGFVVGGVIIVARALGYRKKRHS